MTDYVRQTKANLENKIETDEMNDELDDEFDITLPPTNFIIDNFKTANNTFNVILAQREIDLQRITNLSVKVEQGKAMIDRVNSQKYNMALENSNLKIEIEESKQLALKTKQDTANMIENVNKCHNQNCQTIFILNFIFTLFYSIYSVYFYTQYC